MIASNVVTLVTESTDNLIKFPKLNLEFNVDSVAFTIGGFEIAWYGVIITIGMIIAMIFGFSQMKKFGIDPDKGIDCVIAGIFGGIIGARLYYVVMEIEKYKTFKDVIDIRSGGLAIYGGIIGALLFACIIAKIRKVRILPLLDVAAMGFLIGQSIGRWGNFCNHEAFGTYTELPWGMTSDRILYWILDNTDLTVTTTQFTVHPCFLYESLWNLIGFIVIYFVISKRRKFDGEVFLSYVAWYGFGRAFIEGLRLDSLMIGTMRVSQVLAIVSCIAALVMIFVFRQKVKQLGTDYVLYADSDEFKHEMEIAARKIQDEKNKKSKSTDDSEPESDTDESDDSYDDEEAVDESENAENSTEASEDDNVDNDENVVSDNE